MRTQYGVREMGDVSERERSKREVESRKEKRFVNEVYTGM